MPNGTFVSHQPLKQILLLAFEIKPFQLAGVPDWDPAVMYDSKGLYSIEAKASGPVAEAQCKLMVQLLLADRYKMVTHRDQREIPVYALVVGKNGPKLKKALDTDSTGNNIILNGNPMGIAAGRPADFKRSWLVHGESGRFPPNRSGPLSRRQNRSGRELQDQFELFNFQSRHGRRTTGGRWT